VLRLRKSPGFGGGLGFVACSTWRATVKKEDRKEVEEEMETVGSAEAKGLQNGSRSRGWSQPWPLEVESHAHDLRFAAWYRIRIQASYILGFYLTLQSSCYRWPFILGHVKIVLETKEYKTLRSAFEPKQA